jgi:Subtilase family
MKIRVAFMIGASLMAAGRGAAETKIDPAVEQELAQDASVRVIIQTRPDPDIEGGGPSMVAPQAYVSQLLSLSTSAVKGLGSARAVSTRINAAQLERLRLDPNVEAIIADIPVPPTTDVTVRLIGADRVHSRGFKGTNLAVAVLDTGIDRAHPALANTVSGEACFSTTSGGAHPSTTLCPNGLDVSTLVGAAGRCPANVEGCDHGTHVAGIVAGRPTTRDGRNYSGVSPGAKLVPLQVFSLFTNPADCNGRAPCVLSYPSDQFRALEWVLKKRQELRIAAVNMSLGGGYFDHPCDSESALTEVIERLRAKGVPTVIAAGNSGYYDGVSMPGCISSAVTVSATDKQGAIDVAYSNVAPYVDIAAPGTDIASTVPGASYAAKSGTSMAAPHVAGALALLREEYPNASSSELEAKLRSGAPSVVDGRTGTSLAALEVAHTLPSTAGGPSVAATVPAATLLEQSFIIQTSSSDQQVASSIQSVCSNEACELKRIGDQAWKLDVPAQAEILKGKGAITPNDILRALPSLSADTKIFPNTPAAPVSAKSK